MQADLKNQLALKNVYIILKNNSNSKIPLKLVLYIMIMIIET